MSSRRNNSSSGFVFFLILAMMFALFTKMHFVVWGLIAYGIYRMFVAPSRRNNSWDRRREFERPNSEKESRQRPWQNAPRRNTRPTAAPRRPAPPQRPKHNPFKASGISKYKDYEYKEAIEDFKKALSIDPDDVAVHFNIACAYSIMEEPQNALIHLDKAVRNGFKDFEKIQNHDALAFVRIQDDFEKFVKNGYKLGPVELSPEEKAEQSGNLLEQLQKLGELRDKGLLTDEEFQKQKKKLLG